MCLIVPFAWAVQNIYTYLLRNVATENPWKWETWSLFLVSETKQSHWFCITISLEFQWGGMHCIQKQTFCISSICMGISDNNSL